MGIEEKLWRWYERHTYAIQAVFDIAQDLIPGGKIVGGALKAVHAFWHDKEENRNQDQIEELQQMMAQVKPEMSDLVEDIEATPEFKQAGTPEQARQILEQKFGPELRDVISRISPAVSMSAKRLSAGSNTEKRSPNKLIAGKYELLRKIGSGGQGEVYEARDIDAAKSVAIKMLPVALSQDSSALLQLREEYHRVVDLLIHANIVQYRSIAQDATTNQWFLVMDYVPGSNLRKWMLEQRGQSWTLKRTVDFLLPIIQALHFAHQNKVVHCDLKPENILIRGNDGKLFLSDFGLAKEIHSTLSAIKPPSLEDISGTLPYMSPEQYQGRWPDHRTDIWAFGVILYEIVAGYHPFHGISYEHFRDLICNQEPEHPLHIAPHEWEILLSLLAKDRNQRANGLIQALQPLWDLPSDAPDLVYPSAPILHASRDRLPIANDLPTKDDTYARPITKTKPETRSIPRPRIETDTEDSQHQQKQVEQMAENLYNERASWPTSSPQTPPILPPHLPPLPPLPPILPPQQKPGCLRTMLALFVSSTTGCFTFCIISGLLFAFLHDQFRTELQNIFGTGWESVVMLLVIGVTSLVTIKLMISIWRAICGTSGKNNPQKH